MKYAIYWKGKHEDDSWYQHAYFDYIKYSYSNINEAFGDASRRLETHPYNEYIVREVLE